MPPSFLRKEPALSSLFSSCAKWQLPCSSFPPRRSEGAFGAGAGKPQKHDKQERVEHENTNAENTGEVFHLVPGTLLTLSADGAALLISEGLTSNFDAASGSSAIHPGLAGLLPTCAPKDAN
jgi:hypothetical protein